MSVADANKNISLLGTKVRLKPFTEADINDDYISWLNDLDVVKYSNQRFFKHNKHTCLKYLLSFNGSSNVFLSICKLDGSAIGTMTAYISSHHGTADVGILIGDKSVWGTGCGQDAWDTMTEWLFKQLNIRKITAGTLACNRGMVKIFERSNMTLEAIRRDQEVIANELVDVLYYAKFNDA